MEALQIFGGNSMLTKGKFVGSTDNGIRVFDRNDNHSSVHPVAEDILKEALLHISTCEDYVKETINFGRIIGKTTCVKVDNTDTIIMARRKGRKGPTPLVLGRTAEDCSSLVVILRKCDDGDYILVTYFIGILSEREPWDPAIVPGSAEEQRAITFWNTHALIYDERIVA